MRVSAADASTRYKGEAMKDITRRGFFKVVGSVLTGAAVTVLPIGAESKRVARKKLRRFDYGDVLSSDYLNDMVDAINALQED